MWRTDGQTDWQTLPQQFCRSINWRLWTFAKISQQQFLQFDSTLLRIFRFGLPKLRFSSIRMFSGSVLGNFYLPTTMVTRNSPGDEIANVNFLTDDIVHTLQNTIYSMNSATDLCGWVGTQVYQSQWNNAMQRPLRRSRSFKVTDFGTNRKLIYDFLLVINSNLPPILHRFRVMADYWSNFYYSESRVSYFIALAGGDHCQYRHKWYIAKN